MRIAFTPTFIKRFKILPKELQEEAIEKIELFKNWSNHKQLKVHKLRGILNGCYSFSVNYQTRIIFSFLTKDEVVLHTIGDHEVYK